MAQLSRMHETRGRKPIYDWQHFADGRPHVIIADSTIARLRRSAKTWSASRGYRVDASQTNSGRYLRVTFTKVEVNE